MQAAAAPVEPCAQPDTWVCIWGAYSSRKFYAHYFRDVEADDAFWWIWKSRCTMKIKFFAWLLAAHRINTRNMLRRRHYNVGDDVNCALCQGGVEETVEHLFFGCPFSAQCWSSVFLTLMGDSHRLCAIHSGQRCWTQPMYMEVLMTGAWSIWKEHNNKIFRGIPHSIGS